MTDRSSKAEFPTETPQASCSTARWLRKLKGPDRSKENTFAVYPRESEPTRPSLETEEPNKDPDTRESNLQKYYAPIDTYEGRHRYDIKAKWTPAQEKKLVRRLDWKICSW